MLIRKLSIENFKGIKSPVEFDFSAITLLFGPNSAGKSTVLHAISYLNDIINHHQHDSDSTHLGQGAINLGGFKQFINEHDIDKSVRFHVELDLKDEDLSETKSADFYTRFFDSIVDDEEREFLIDLGLVSEQINSAAIAIEVAWSHYANTSYVKCLILTINDEKLLSVKGTHSRNGGVISYFNTSHSVLLDRESTEPVSIMEPILSDYIESQFLDETGRALIGIENTKDALPDWKSGLKLTDIWSQPVHARQNQEVLFVGIVQSLLCGVLEIVGTDLKETKYIGPLRKVPDRNFLCSKNVRQSWANGLAAWDCLAQNGERFVTDVNYWLAGSSKFNSGYKVALQRSKNIPTNSKLMGLLDGDELNANRELIRKELDNIIVNEKVVLNDIRRNIEVQPIDVGAGISQMLPVIVGALEPTISMLMVEQPELHIHPKLQVELAELMLDTSEKLEKHFLIETHSEHLVLRLLRKVREHEISPEKLIVYYIDTVKGETKVRKIRIAEDGTFLDRWPKGGFFPERAKELFDVIR